MLKTIAAPLPRELWRFLRWGADYPGVADLWPRWCAMVDDLSDPDFELTVEDFGPVLALFLRLERLGVIFDEGFARLMRGLEASGIGSGDDTDVDTADDLLNLDSDDDDGGDGPTDDDPDFPALPRHRPVNEELRRLRRLSTR